MVGMSEFSIYILGFMIGLIAGATIERNNWISNSSKPYRKECRGRLYKVKDVTEESE